MNKLYDNRVKGARLFAVAAHSAIDHKRKYTLEPYWMHPVEVATIVASVPHTSEMLMAAYLHDVVEDTEVEIEDINREFGYEVSKLVGWLTDVSKPSDGNRAVRKGIDRDHTAKAPPEAQTIKIADLISNSKSIAEHDPVFAKVYFKEKAALLKVMPLADPSLMKIAMSQLDLDVV